MVEKIHYLKGGKGKKRLVWGWSEGEEWSRDETRKGVKGRELKRVVGEDSLIKKQNKKQELKDKKRKEGIEFVGEE